MAGNNPFEHMVEKNQWDKINSKTVKANVQTKLEIAEACSKSSEDESMNILIRFLTDTDESVQLQAIKSLGISGRSSTKTHLFWLSEHLPADKEVLKKAIKESLASISARH
jgi:HEAT repeat protein